MTLSGVYIYQLRIKRKKKLLVKFVFLVILVIESVKVSVKFETLHQAPPKKNKFVFTFLQHFKHVTLSV